MASDEKSIRDQVLEELAEACMLYLNLGDYIKAHEMAKIPRKENRPKVEPGLDMIILRSDIWKRLKSLRKKYHLYNRTYCLL